MPTPPQHSLIVTPSAAPAPAEAPRILRGAEPATLPDTAPTIAPPDLAETLAGMESASNPILSLFSGAGLAAKPSFRDALLGQKATPGTSAHRWPLPSAVRQSVSSDYGVRADPLNSEASYHSGLDISAASGTPVLASADGDVIRAGTEGAYGKSITLAHADGSESSYGHLSAYDVQVGDRVKVGQKIGAVGATGRVTGAHLDYRLVKDGLHLDPLAVLAGRPASIPTPAAEKPSTIATPHAPVVNPVIKPRAPAKSERLIVVK